MNTPSAPLRIGEWVLFPDRNELDGPAGARRLQPRLTALLLALAATPGRTVTREALLETVWTRKVLNDEVLSRGIADLRVALEDDAREPRYIETIPKTGYRLVAAVGPVEAPEPPEPPEPPERSECGSGVSREDSRSDVAASKPRPIVPVILGALALAVAVLAVLFPLIQRPVPEPMAAASPHPLTPDAVASARPLTSDPGWELSPRLSADGTQIAYASAQDTNDLQRSVIVLQGLDGTHRRELGAEDPALHLCPVFSPDGRDLLWLRSTRDGCVLLRQPVTGGDRRELAVCAARLRSCPDWSSDGASLVFTAPPAGADRGAGLALLDFASGAVTRVTDPPIAEGNDTEPRFVPGSADVTFSRGTESGRLLARVARTGGAVTQPRTERELSYGHDWSPDGGAAIFAADSLGPRSLLRLAPDGTVSLLGAQGARYPDLSANGTLVYELARYDANLWRVVPGSNAEPLRLTLSTRYDGQPSLAPDGTRVVYGSNRDGLDTLWIVGTDGTGDQRLPLDAATRWVRPNWLPDGSGLLLTRYGPEGTDIWRLRFAADAPEPLGLAPGHYDARYDDTGEWLYVLRDTPAGRALLRTDAALRAPPVEIVAAPINRYVVRNGRVAYHRNDGDDIVICAADGTACRASGVGLAPERRGAWDLADDALYFAATGDDGRSALFRLPLAGGAREQVATLAPSTIGPSLSVARDGSQAIAARTDSLELDLMIVDARGAPRAHPGE